MTSPLARFHPRLLDALRGYNRERLAKDVGSGLTVGIVALPLAMAFAIASGLKPEAGLWTAIIAGFIISALGGTTAQIGGPAGAFIVIVYGIVERYGVANLLIATACAGVLLFALGLFKLGTLVRYVPVSIVIGFTNGIAVLIALSQVKDWLGLEIIHMPGDFFSQIKTIAAHIDTVNVYALALGSVCVLGLYIWPRVFVEGSPIIRLLEGRRVQTFARVPGPIMALVTLSMLAWALDMPVETLGSRFGSIPDGLPAFALPDFSWETVRLLVTPTLTIALLGAIESLLCARVADQLASDPHYVKHDPNQELMAQGIANMVVPFFGGMPATGTIARTVTNIRSGATSPVAGIVHALVLAAVVLVAAPLALYIPLAVLSGILLFVAWNMGEWHEFVRLRQFSGHYRMLLLGTFFLTVVFDLTVAVEVGMVLACVLFIRRMSSLFRVAPVALGEDAMVYKLYGALFFGAVAKIDPIVQAVENHPRGVRVVLDASQLISLDASGLDALEQLLKAIVHRGGLLYINDVNEQPRKLMESSGFAARLQGFQAAAATP
ncbi:SulP family sulfate permease [Rhodoferax ferrireducens]|uniref:SulP family sulfate permease n=1 Tax=Rhodoferax ferrireducens TaxID=192843 RepID=A0ABU2C3X8_9BURK|nr:SulP family inorganic anion transporter [Rhodoferax ferrireducens]MDR7376032.1 SulP family sulfate permease [Rhodoferax ferrireducens]